MSPSEAPQEVTKDAEEIDLIDVVNALQNKLAASGHTLDVSLPQIVVVGCQSAGKSSVLESFVGKEFLPRGAKVVTRRPIVVQLIPSAEEYGIFLHKEEEKFYDFNAIKEEIIRVTDEECGPLGFSKKPISLKIFSPRVLKLTVVDLPGIIRVTVGEQTEESVQVIRDMVLEYIMQEKCIILAVTPVGQDISNSDALEIAKIADPDRIRTIGVLTKLDLMDEGTDAREILENTHLPLKRGWVGVINRSAKDIAEGKDMQYILKKEKDFFRKNEQYCHMAHRMGTPYLQKLLQRTLRTHIKEFLPAVRSDISQKLSRFDKEIKTFNSIIGSGPNAKQFYMIKLIQKFCSDVHMKIMGYSERVSTKELAHGAQINYTLYTEVQKNITQNLIPNEEDLVILIANLNGMRNSISVPALAVDAMCRSLIKLFKEPLEISVLCVKDILMNAVRESSELMDSYPSIKNELLYQIQHWVEQEAEKTTERLKAHVDAEMFYINIGHPDFDSSTCDPVAPPAGPVKVWINENGKKSENNENSISILVKKLKENEQMQNQVKYVTAIVIKYLEIVQKQISDVAIKYISYFLVKKVLDSINQDLVPTIVNSANVASLTEDCEDEFRRKEELQMTCNALQEALDAIKAF